MTCEDQNILHWKSIRAIIRVLMNVRLQLISRSALISPPLKGGLRKRRKIEYICIDSTVTMRTMMRVGKKKIQENRFFFLYLLFVHIMLTIRDKPTCWYFVYQRRNLDCMSCLFIFTKEIVLIVHI